MTRLESKSWKFWLTFTQWSSMFEMKLDTIFEVLLLNSSHVKVNQNKHCQIKNCTKVHNKLTTIEGSKFENVMLQLVGFWNWCPQILVMIEDLLSYLDMISIISANSQIARSSWKFGTNTLVVLLFWMQTTIRLSLTIGVTFMFSLFSKWSTTIVSAQLTFALWKDNEMIESQTMQQSNHKTKNQIETKVRRKILPLTSLKLHVLRRRPHQRIKNDHHIFHER